MTDFAPLAPTDVVLDRVPVDRWFARWIAGWAARGGARVLVAKDGSHAIAVAFPGHEPVQLPIPGARGDAT